MTQKNWTLEGKNRTLVGEWSKIVENRRTLFMYDPLALLRFSEVLNHIGKSFFMHLIMESVSKFNLLNLN